GRFNEDPPHGFGCGSEEMAAALPALGLLYVHQAQVGFVDQGGGLQGLPRLLLGQPVGREPAQLVVDQGQQLLGGGRVALLDGGQDTRDIAHGVKVSRRRGDRPASGRESTGGGRVPGQKRQPLWVIYRAAGCPYRFWRLTVSGSTTPAPAR